VTFTHCPNCRTGTGHKRALGFGTVFAVIVTGGLWLFALPLYPPRCIQCGMVAPAIGISFSRRSLNASPGFVITVVALLVACAVSIVCNVLLRPK
jgi:hypothetical protein